MLGTMEKLRTQQYETARSSQRKLHWLAAVYEVTPPSEISPQYLAATHCSLWKSPRMRTWPLLPLILDNCLHIMQCRYRTESRLEDQAEGPYPSQKTTNR